MSNGRYVLDADGEPALEPDLMKWAHWLETSEAQIRVAFDEVEREVAPGCTVVFRVSTVFLALDHCHDHGPPVLWETMVFHGDHHDDHQERATSRSGALACHQAALALVRAGAFDAAEAS